MMMAMRGGGSACTAMLASNPAITGTTHFAARVGFKCDVRSSLCAGLQDAMTLQTLDCFDQLCVALTIDTCIKVQVRIKS
jgi:hypothetical protein